MCITLLPASLTNTKILTIRLQNGRHFTAYSNNVKNLSGKPNAMILPIPGITKPEWFHDTTMYNNFLDEIAEATKVTYRSLRLGANAKGVAFTEFVLGIYQVGLADSFQGAEAFIDSLPESKRPDVSQVLRDFFSAHYKGYSFAVCVFSADETSASQPIAYEYEPANSEILFYPTMDAHDGSAPAEGQIVDVDHTFIFVESAGSQVNFSQNVPDFIKSSRYRQWQVVGPDINGDVVLTKETFKREFKID